MKVHSGGLALVSVEERSDSEILLVNSVLPNHVATEAALVAVVRGGLLEPLQQVIALRATIGVSI